MPISVRLEERAKRPELRLNVAPMVSPLAWPPVAMLGRVWRRAPRKNGAVERARRRHGPPRQHGVAAFCREGSPGLCVLLVARTPFRRTASGGLTAKNGVHFHFRDSQPGAPVPPVIPESSDPPVAHLPSGGARRQWPFSRKPKCTPKNVELTRVKPWYRIFDCVWWPDVAGWLRVLQRHPDKH